MSNKNINTELENDMENEYSEEELAEQKELEERKRAKRKRIITVTATIIIIIIILLLLHRCGSDVTGPGEVTPTEPTSQTEIVPDNPEATTVTPNSNGKTRITFGGYFNKEDNPRYVKKGETINFSNPIENSLNMVFELKYHDTVIWTSEPTKPGEKAHFVASDYLKQTGGYNLTLAMWGVFDDGSATSGTNGNYTVVVTE